MSLDKKNEETKGITAVIILEIIGRPPEHLVETLEELIKSMDKEKGVSVKSKKINEPVLMKDQKQFYTTFAEIEIEVKEILYLAVVMFKYMPAHVEVIEPELIALTNSGWTEILSEITRRLHGYDEVARVLQFENSQMQKKLKELTPEENKINEEKGEGKKRKGKKEKKK
jgi:membrane protein insertase Oxa1/YidC/SpoIIIJ